MSYHDVNQEDIATALKNAGSNHVYIDRQDYVSAMKNMGSDRIYIDDQDIPGVIMNAGGGLPPDVTPPVPSSFSPADNAIGVNTAPLLIAMFSNFIRLGTAGNITIKKTSDDSVVEAWNVATEAGTGAGQVNVFQGRQLTMRLTAPLAAATGYYILWDAGVVKDLPGNNCVAQASKTFWNFTTA
jgi:hypothetical protein